MHLTLMLCRPGRQQPPVNLWTAPPDVDYYPVATTGTALVVGSGGYPLRPAARG